MKRTGWVLLLLCSIKLWGQKPFTKSVLDLENDNNYSSFSVLDSLVANNYRLFFTGEDHTFLNANSQTELKMFKYLHKTAGVRVFMMEFGNSMGYITNKYIQTGDTILRNIIKDHTFTEYYSLFTGLRGFYDSLPQNEKFTVVSVDVEREPVYPVKLLEYLLPADKTAHDSISIHIDAIKALSEFFDDESTKRRNRGEEYMYNYWDYKDVRNDSAYTKLSINTYYTVRLIVDNFNAHKEKYVDYLGDNFGMFEKEIRSIEDFFVFDGYGRGAPGEGYSSAAQQYIYRENYMEANVLKLIGQNENVKAFGQFGRCHTHRQREKEECNYYYFNSLASRLNTKKNSPLFGKVFSCPMFYPNAYDFMDANVSINRGLKKMIESTGKNAVTLFLLNAGDTALGTLPQRFNAIIINNNEKDENSTNQQTSYQYDFIDNWSEKLIFLAEGGVSSHSFKNLNNTIGTDFKTPPQFLGFSVNFTENNEFSLSTGYQWYQMQEQKLSDSVSVSLSGTRFKFMVGSDLLKKAKYDLNAMVGFGYERWVIESRETFDEPGRKDIFGNNRTTTYINPAFLLMTGLDFRVHLNWITFGTFAGYQRDLSNKHWRVNSNISSNTPKQSLSAFTFGVSAGVNIDTF